MPEIGQFSVGLFHVQSKYLQCLLIHRLGWNKHSKDFFDVKSETASHFSDYS